MDDLFLWNNFDNVLKSYEQMQHIHAVVLGDDNNDALDKCYLNHDAKDSAINRFAKDNPDFRKRVLCPLTL